MSLQPGELQELASEIKHLVRAGLPLEVSLASAGAARGERLKAVVAQIENRLQQGETVQKILESHSFGGQRLLASAVTAGLQAGSLDLTVEMMGDHASDVLELRSRIVQAASYPLSIAAMAFFLLWLVIQHFLELYRMTLSDWRLDVAPLLRNVLEWNHRAPWWVFLIPVGLIFGLLIRVNSRRSTGPAFHGAARCLLLLPGVFSLVRDLQSYTLTRMLSLMTDRGLPLHNALLLAGSCSGSRSLEKGCHRIASRLQNGLSVGALSDPRGPDYDPAVRALPPLLRVSLKQVEQQEERLLHRLRTVASFYRGRFERVSFWMRMVLPVAMFVLIAGTCVLGYALLVFWPVSELYMNMGS